MSFRRSATKSATLGLKFYSDVPGSVTGVRFYKGASNTGTHVGVLWSSTGTKLATVNFAAETASGWQQANFSSPVSITANTTYVISYTAPNGGHAHDQYYSWPNLNASVLPRCRFRTGRVISTARALCFLRALGTTAIIGWMWCLIPQRLARQQVSRRCGHNRQRPFFSRG